MSGADPSTPVHALALCDRPGEVAPVLEALEGWRWSYAAAPDEVRPALDARRPSVVFSIKHAGFPGPAHLPAYLEPGVRWFHVGGAGTDHLDGHLRGGVRLTTSAGVLAPFLAERALAGLLHLVTGMGPQLAAQAERRWAPTRFRPLAGRRVLVVGAGATGAAFARRVRAFGCEVTGVRASGAPREGFDRMFGPGELDRLLGEADVLSLHVRLTPATRHLIDGRRLGLLPEGALLLNAARGAVLEEGALPAALEGGLAGAWLDVFEEEPLPATSPLWHHPRVLVSPHHADQVEDFPARFARHFVELARRGGPADPGAPPAADPPTLRP